MDNVFICKEYTYEPAYGKFESEDVLEICGDLNEIKTPRTRIGYSKENEPYFKKRKELMEQLYKQGLNYRQIAKYFDLSYQRVASILGKNDTRLVHIKESQCIYPKLRKWLMDNNISISGLSREIYGNHHPAQVEKLSRFLRGNEIRGYEKRLIDKILEVTGLTYEIAFYKG